MKKTIVDSKVRLTKNQKLVFDVLVNASQPLGAYSILNELLEHGFKSPLTVYRALNQLTSKGLLRKFEFLDELLRQASLKPSSIRDL